jgi:tRNA A-37 threonylcarbamoyl transferase component Bud32
MKTDSTCATCGTPTAAGMLGGLCPACLRRVAFAAPSLDGVTRDGTFPERVFGHCEPPPASEVAALLPDGSYTVDRLIGRGGMGAVYQGMQLRLKRPVAIKLMRQDQGADEGFRLRFQREALLLASLDHPGIVKVIDCGEAGPDLLYIVMELVDGVNLMDVIRSGGVSEKRALDIVEQVCAALRFAHENGIVHRDIKPSNILLSRDGRVRIADFGLAMALDPDGPGSEDHGIGTPSYAAPEQMRADGKVDQRADLYAVGVMIYQMLTGALPQDGWKPPSQLVAVDPGWDRIVSKALEAMPENRLSGLDAMQEMLSRISPVDSGRIRRRRLMPVVLGVAAVVLLAAFWMIGSRRAKAPEYPLPKAWVDATPEVIEAAQMYDFGATRNGAIEITGDAHVDLAGRREFDDVAMRVTYSGVVSLGLRGIRDEYYLGTVRSNGDAEITMGFLRTDRRPDFKPAVYPLGKSYDPAATHEMVLAAQGGLIRMWIDGQLVTSLRDPSLARGMLMLRAYVKPELPARVMRLEYGHLGGDASPGMEPQPEFKPAPGTIAHRLTSPDFKWNGPFHLGRGINGKTDDSGPHISPDSRILTYQSNREVKMRFYECRRGRPGESFGAPTVVDGIVVNWAMTPWITHDRRTLVYGSPNGPDHQGSSQDLYICTRSGPDAPWGPPMNLKTVNSPTHDQAPCLTSDGLTLYFGSLRRGGFGGHDLWRASRRSVDEPFGDVTNLGPTVNTFIQDRDLQMAPDDRTLLFVRMFGESPQLGSVLHVAVPDSRGEHHVLPIELPVKGMITDPCVSADGSELWFAWEGPFGEGGRDLWRFERVPVGTEDAPVSHPALASRHAPFENSLGMRFLPVTIPGGRTDQQRVLFSVWETRVRDYAVFVKETGREWMKVAFDQDDSHPAAMLVWDDGRAFCKWLTDRERGMGVISADLEYRLPSDHEWSCAAGFGEKEDADQPPAMKGKGPWNWYIWGESWPPPEGVANLMGEEARGLLQQPGYQNIGWVIGGFRDTFVHSAPVGSFPANPNGMHDLSGNLWEWCEDRHDQDDHIRVLRGHSFLCNSGAGAKLSARGSSPVSAQQPIYGVRVVLAPAREAAGQVADPTEE